jgi:hypothetical protein
MMPVAARKAENAVGRMSNRNVEAARLRVHTLLSRRCERVKEYTYIVSERRNNGFALLELDFSILKQQHDYAYSQTKNLSSQRCTASLQKCQNFYKRE